MSFVHTGTHRPL